MPYSTECELVDHCVARLGEVGSPWGSLDLVREFFYHRGRVDVAGVAADGHVVAFEAKLTRWRDALQQAYRNTCFAHSSYVWLPWDIAQVAFRYTDQFERRRVGGA
jgi:hypothetical protein